MPAKCRLPTWTYNSQAAVGQGQRASKPRIPNLKSQKEFHGYEALSMKDQGAGLIITFTALFGGSVGGNPQTKQVNGALVRVCVELILGTVRAAQRNNQIYKFILKAIMQEYAGTPNVRQKRNFPPIGCLTRSAHPSRA